MREQTWRRVIQELNLDLSRPINTVTADDIKRITGREPRLEAYVDQRDRLPRFLSEHGVFPLAIRNGVYALVRGDGFHDLEQMGRSPKRFKSQLEFSLATRQQGLGEDRYLLYAFNSGLVSDFSGVQNWFPMGVGRQRLRPIRFHVGGAPFLEADGVQFQVDLLLESLEQIMIFEAKTDGLQSFFVRQLYYPFRHWQAEVPGKQARTVFFLYEKSTDLYYFWEYVFADPLDYSSIELKAMACYRIEGVQRGLDEFLDVTPAAVDSFPRFFQVPQANDVDKVQQLPLRVAQGIDSSAKVAEYFRFTKRQSSYYRDAAEGLGFVELAGKDRYRLTSLGEEYVRLPVQERNRLFARRLLRHPIMNEVLRQLADRKAPRFAEDDIARIIRQRSRLTGTTPARRASTIFSWFKWLGTAVGIVTISENRIQLAPGHQQ